MTVMRQKAQEVRRMNIPLFFLHIPTKQVCKYLAVAKSVIEQAKFLHCIKTRVARLTNNLIASIYIHIYNNFSLNINKL